MSVNSGNVADMIRALTPLVKDIPYLFNKKQPATPVNESLAIRIHGMASGTGEDLGQAVFVLRFQANGRNRLPATNIVKT